MKILRVTSSGFSEGGAEKGIEHIQPILEAKGHEVRILSSDSGRDKRHFNDFSYRQPHGLLGKFSYTWNHSAYRILKQVLNEFKPDIVHLHTLGAASPSVLFALRNYPTIATVHGPEGYTRELIIWNQPKEDFVGQDMLNKKLTLRGKLRNLYYRFVNYPLYRIGLRNVDRIVSISNYIKDVLSRQGMESTLIKNGVKRFKCTPLSAENITHTILFTGRVEKTKGVEYMIRALPTVVERFTDTKLLIAGTGSERNNLEALVRELHLESHVTFLGYVSGREDLEQLYEKASLIVVPSIWAEISSRSGIEAQSAGRPVIASRVGGISDWLSDGETGLFVEPGDSQAIADSIIELFSHPQRLISMGRKARQKSDEFDLELHADRIEEVYREVIARFKQKGDFQTDNSGGVYYVTDTYLRDSSAQAVHVDEICTNLMHLGHAVRLYIPCSRHFTKERSYQIHELWVPVFAASVMFQIQLMLKLSLDIIRHRPRMLYVRHSLLLFVAVLIGRLFNIPTVLEVNGKLIEEARHHGRSLLTILLDRSHIFSFIEGFNLRNATYVVAVTEGIKSYLVERYTLSPRVVAVINNGVNTETFMPQDMSYARSQIGLPQDRIIVGYIGSFYSWQGLPHILEAARQLRDAGEPMLFVLVGHGADEACLRKGLKRNKLESTVMLIPSIQRSNVPLYINAFDICLSVPTRFRNGATSPFKVYEYLACGKPTIVSDIDGMREEFQDAVYYVEPESPKALVAALRVLAHNGDARGACSMRARSFIREGHDWRTIAQRIASLVSGDSTPGDEALMKAERNAELCASRNLS